MAIYEIQGPDGRTYQVEAPSQEAAISGFRSAMGQQEPVGVGEDVARSAVGGAITGTADVVQTPSLLGRAVSGLINRGVEALGFETGYDEAAAARPTQNLIEQVGEFAPSIQQAAEYQPQTLAGEYAQTAGEFLPGAVFTPGGPLSRIGMGVLAPALTSETAGQIAQAANLGPTGEAIARVGGAVLGPTALSSAARRIISPTGGANAARLQAANVLEEAGIPISAGQRTGSTLLRAAEDTLQPSTEQLEAFTKAAMRSIGSEADTASKEALEAAAGRIGSVFDDVARGIDAAPTPGSGQQFASIANTYRQIAPTSGRAPLVDNIADAVQEAIDMGRQIPAETLMNWRSGLSRLTKSSDTATREVATEALQALDGMLDDALRAAGRSDDIARLAEARRQYRDFLAIERAAAQRSEGAAIGILSPQAVEGALSAQSRRQLVRGQRGDLGTLARSAGAVLRPSSATLPGGVRAIQGAIPAASAAAGFGLGGLGGAILGAAAPSLGRAAINTRPMQTYLGNQLLGAAAPRLTAAQRLMLYGPQAAQN
jgi:hypothetical protein